MFRTDGIRVDFPNVMEDDTVLTKDERESGTVEKVKTRPGDGLDQVNTLVQCR